MDDFDTIKENALDEIAEQVTSLADAIRDGITASEGAMTITDLERRWTQTRKTTEGIVSDMVGRLLGTVNERDLVRKKRIRTTWNKTQER